jgi:UDP-galactopyranose mutase
MDTYDILVVGCGLSGVVIAERFANILNKKVLIVEKRSHIAGNCYDYIDSETNILMNKYGAHLFHTNNEKVWNYVNQFDEWVRWDHQVIGLVDDIYVPIPVNINTVNSLLGENISSESEMNKWLDQSQVKYDRIENSEQMGQNRVGKVLYDKIFKDYTYKQWNKYPEELDSSVLARIPVRNNFDNRYFNDKYQALPKMGYTHFVQNILNNPNIVVLLDTDFFEFKQNHDLDQFEKIFYTGPIDAFYSDLGLEKLEYRSIHFDIERIVNVGYYQPNSVVNYPSNDVEFTRIVEYKHFLNQKSNDTVIVREYSTNEGEPYYPVPNKKNLELYQQYQKHAENEPHIHFLGRLANYKYFNMDEAIANSLTYFEKFL